MELDTFCDMAKEFVQESGWPITYSKLWAEYSFQCMQNNKNIDIITIQKDNNTQAAAILCLDYMGHHQPFGYIVKFYIRKKHRDGKTAMKLMHKCNKWFDDKKVVASFCTPMAGIDDMAAIKLLERFGYQQQWSGVRYGKI